MFLTRFQRVLVGMRREIREPIKISDFNSYKGSDTVPPACSSLQVVEDRRLSNLRVHELVIKLCKYYNYTIPSETIIIPVSEP